MIAGFFSFLYNGLKTVIGLTFFMAFLLGYFIGSWRGTSKMEAHAIEKGYAGYVRTVTKLVDGGTEINYEFKWKEAYPPGADIRQKKIPLSVKYGAKFAAWAKRNGAKDAAVYGGDGRVLKEGDLENY